jgi:hypothetical protein
MLYLPVWLACWLLFLHWFGDYILQSNHLALRKADDALALLQHVIIVALTLFIGSLPLAVIGLVGWNPLVQFVGVNFTAHLVTDYVTSKVNKQLWFVDVEPRGRSITSGDYASFPFYAKFDREKRHWFFVSLGFDQFLHQLVLLITASYYLRYILPK